MSWRTGHQPQPAGISVEPVGRQAQEHRARPLLHIREPEIGRGRAVHNAQTVEEVGVALGRRQRAIAGRRTPGDAEQVWAQRIALRGPRAGPDAGILASGSMQIIERPSSSRLGMIVLPGILRRQVGQQRFVA